MNHLPWIHFQGSVWRGMMRGLASLHCSRWCPRPRRNTWGCTQWGQRFPCAPPGSHEADQWWWLAPQSVLPVQSPSHHTPPFLRKGYNTTLKHHTSSGVSFTTYVLVLVLVLSMLRMSWEAEVVWTRKILDRKHQAWFKYCWLKLDQYYVFIHPAYIPW